ncbi:chemotaxis protein CheW [Bacteriovorax stolpii]|uniref:Chemotaxis protein CheW n=1 Tax=Bacteriovorax stolpii TaxID=960 RepID=A0A2K9NSG4_BACTC|nr:chemotaxis protein CheW [Bacteriovorax stolpii]AUN98459.1 chemotaxis protein CheW [Bacteriovorax stolpii]QDK41561.1 chemotaxis protein CheW [Bacteriovorax stolpii]TDP50916.1 purine-binding chemotaxis protein CheW [Bacteriovorax stolpii]
MKYISFRLENNSYAVSILKIKEVIAEKNITPVPLNPNHLSGIINVRGIIIPIVDLCLKLNLRTDEDNFRKTIIILEVKDKLIGVLVDSVSSILDAKADEIKPVSENLITFKKNYIEGVISDNERLHLLINLEDELKLVA